MIYTVIDIETTGTDPKKDSITEICAILFDNKNKSILNLYSSLVIVPSEISPEISKLTGITNKMCDDFGKPWKKIEPIVFEWITISDYSVAHNAEFEDSFLEKKGIHPDWLDTMIDLPYEPTPKSRKLAHICADHDILIDGAHRAFPDTLATTKLLACYDDDDIAKWMKSPFVEIKALVSFDQKDDAKAAGFLWNPDLKSWIAKIKEHKIDDFCKNLDFRYELVNPICPF